MCYMIAISVYTILLDIDNMNYVVVHDIYVLAHVINAHCILHI